MVDRSGDQLGGGEGEGLIARFAPDDPAFIADPYPILNEIRETTPIFHHEATGQWLLTRFDDVTTMLRSRKLGRNYTHRFDHDQFGQPGPDPRWARFNDHERWSLLFLEPPDHTRIRRLISSAFTPRTVAELVPTMTRLSDQLLDRCHEKAGSADGTFDLLADFAQPYSVAVICDLLGVPAEDTDQLLDWSHAIVKMYELEGPDDQKRAADEAAGAFINYVRDLIAEKRRRPDGRLVAELTTSRDPSPESGDATPDRLSDDEITSTVMVLIEAGHEATVNTIGNGFRALLQHPDQWRRLTSGQVDPAVAVEELLRFDSPLQLFARWVLEPFEIAGRRFGVGEEVAGLFGSAQRDPRRFIDPDRFDIDRFGAGGSPPHLAFGSGIHTCVGAPLARAELRTAVAGIVRHFPNLASPTGDVGDPTYQPTFVLRGLTGLPVSPGPTPM